MQVQVTMELSQVSVANIETWITISFVSSNTVLHTIALLRALLVHVMVYAVISRIYF